MASLSVDKMLQAGLILAGYTAKQRNRNYAKFINGSSQTTGRTPSHIACCGKNWLLSTMKEAWSIFV